MENSANEIALILPAAVRVLMPNGQVEEMKLETYLAGAVAAEMGATAPLEALKAQAVASRTYVVSAERHHEQHADVCITGHCQKWKHVDPVTAPEVFRALSETWGMVAVHDGKLIDAFFFEHCDGHTRNSEEMLISAAEYLRGVDCSCGHLTLKGHGVGMCKRGAVVMARRGASFVQILRHYYRGIVVMRMKAEKPAALDLEEIKPMHATETPKKLRARKITREVKPVASKHAKSGRPMIKLHPRPRVTIHPETAPPASDRTLLKEPTLPLPTTPPEEISVPTQTTPQHSEEISVAPAHPRPVESLHALEEKTKAAEATPQIEPAPIVPEPTTARPAEIVSSPQSPIETPAPIEIQPAVEQPISLLQAAVPTVQSQIETPVSVVVEPTVETGMHSPAIPEHELPPLEEIEIKPARRMHVDRLPGPRMIAGCLARAGIVVSIENGDGNKTLVFSGSAPHYGEGGFETVVDVDGTYHVTIESETLEVQVQGETVFIHAA